MEFRPPRFARVGGRRLAYDETAPGEPEGTGHIPEVERADESNADLLTFLAA